MRRKISITGITKEGGNRLKPRIVVEYSLLNRYYLCELMSMRDLSRLVVPTPTHGL